MYNNVIFTGVLSRYEDNLFNELSTNLVFQLNLFIEDKSYIIQKTNIESIYSRYIKELLNELKRKYRFAIGKSTVPEIANRFTNVIVTYLEYEKLMIDNVKFNFDVIGYKSDVDFTLQLITWNGFTFKEKIGNFSSFRRGNTQIIYLLNASHSTTEIYDFISKYTSLK